MIYIAVIWCREFNIYIFFELSSKHMPIHTSFFDICVFLPIYFWETPKTLTTTTPKYVPSTPLWICMHFRTVLYVSVYDMCVSLRWIDITSHIYWWIKISPKIIIIVRRGCTENKTDITHFVSFALWTFLVLKGAILKVIE